MSDRVELKTIVSKGYIQADRVTAENLKDWTESLNGELNEGILRFEIHNRAHYVLVGDWIVVFFPHGDVQVYTDSMFNRIFEVAEPVVA